MFREFNVKFEDVEMLGGANNLLEGTEITKVIVRGDNNKMSSLDSMLKNCNELDTIDGELDLNGVSDIDNLLEGTELVKSIDLKNINNENISANNSFPHVDRINIGGELYNKKAMQNVIASKDWTFDNINYQGTVGDNIVEKEVNIVDDNKTTIQDTLEQKARGFEIIGQTYENLVVGSGETTLLDELTLESVDGSTKEFNPHLEQPICVEAIEGETYQNLVEGKGEYKLTDTFSTTWTESNNSIENPPAIVEVPEIWGNTVQGYADLLSAKDFANHFNNIKWSSSDVYAEFYSDNTFKVIRNTTYHSTEIQSAIASDNSKAIKLKPTTKYTIWVDNGNCSLIVATPSTIPLNSVETRLGSYTFTTDSTGLVGIGLKNTNSTLKTKIRLVEGEVLNLHEIPHDFNLNYIESVGDLYVDEEGSPILDEEGNEQYKLEIISHGYVTDSSNSRSIVQNLFLSSSETFTNITVYAGTPLKAYFQCIAKIDLSKSKTGYFCTFVQGGANSIKYYSTDHSLKFLYENKEYFLGIINHNEPFSITIKQVNSDTSLLVYFNGIEKVRITSTMFGHGNFVAFNSRYNTGIGEGCGSMNIIYAQCSKNIGGYIGVDEDDWANINKWDKTTILMPCQLSRIKGSSTYDITDKLLFNKDKGTYIIEKNINTYTTPTINYTGGLDVNLNLPSDMVGSNNNINNYPFIIEGAKVQGWSTGNLSEFAIKRYNTDKTVRLATSSSFTNEEISTFLSNKNVYYVTNSPQTIETKILEKPSLETYSPKTYISTNAEIQPSKMTVTNKKVDFIPLGLQANKDYTLQLDSTGKNDKPVTVNLGGTETTVQPINDTSKHHKVVVRTPNTLTTDKLELSGEGVVVNDVMLFEGGSNEIKQDVEYVEGIQSIGELQEDGTYKIDILTVNDISNLYTGDVTMELGAWNDSGLSVASSVEIRCKNPFTPIPQGVKNGDVLFLILSDTTINSNTNLHQYDSNKKYTAGQGAQVSKFANGVATITIKDISKIQYFSFRAVSSNTKCKWGLYLENNGFIERIVSTQSILLPQPLNKIGEIKDKFYWDDNKGHYCIEQKVEDYIITKDSPFIYRGYKSLNVYAVLDKEVLGYDLTNKISLLGIKQYNQFPYQADELGYYVNNETGEIEFVIHKLKVNNSLEGILSKLFEVQEEFNFMYGKTTPKIIDLPHLNKKYSLDTYMPTTYLECTNSSMQPSRLLLESDTVRYKPSTLETDTDYTVQFECKEKSDKKVKLNLGGSEKEVDAVVGLNHVSITTPSEIDTSLYKDRLFLSGVGNKVADVIVVEGEMNQYPSYFDGVQNTGELQDDGTYKIEVSTENEFKNTNLWDGKKVSDYVTDFIEIYDNTFSLNSYDAYITEYDADRQLVTREYMTSTANKMLTAKNSNCKYITVRSNIFKETDPYYVKEGLLVLSNRMVSLKEKPTGFRNSLKVLISSNSPLAKGDKLYWNKSNKRYEIDRGGSVEVPTVSGDVIDLPRLYQREDTNLTISTGNIKPSKVKLDYNDLD